MSVLCLEHTRHVVRLTKAVTVTNRSSWSPHVRVLVRSGSPTSHEPRVVPSGPLKSSSLRVRSGERPTTIPG